MEESEYKREREFYEERGLPCPKDMEAETEKEAEQEQEDKEDSPEAAGAGGEAQAAAGGQDFHRFDEQVNLHLESADPDKMRNMSRKYVRVSSLATITHLKKFLAIKILEDDDPEAFRDIDITCDGELIPKVRHHCALHRNMYIDNKIIRSSYYHFPGPYFKICLHYQMEDKRPTVKVSGYYLILIIE